MSIQEVVARHDGGKRELRLIVRMALAVTLLLGNSAALRAHGDPGGQIEEISAQIEARPNDALLFLRRGELYRTAELFLFASDDFDQAEQLNPAMDIVHLARANNFFAWRKPAAGLAAIDRFLQQEPERALLSEARQLRGQLLLALDRPLDAAQDFALAIQHSIPPPSPDLYAFRAGAFEAAGEQYFGAAVQSLDDGIARLGPIVGLMQPALELELRLRRYDAALARVDRLIAAIPLHASLLARRAEILLTAGKQAEAHVAFEQTLATIVSLSERRRDTQIIKNLEAQVRARIAELSVARLAATNAFAH